MSAKIRKPVDDLGAAAYLKMHAYRALGRDGKNVYFELSADEEDQFYNLITEYLNSEFHNFDHHLMSIKKLPQYRG